jgi:poly(A) polymerase
MFEEFLKLFISGKAVENFNLLREYNLFQYFFPATEALLKEDVQEPVLAFILQAMKNTDHRINTNQRVTPAFLIAAMLWHPLQKQLNTLNKENPQLTPQDAFFTAYGELISEQQQSISIPKHFQGVMKDIWILQEKLVRREGKRAYKTFEHPKFRAGYDFLLLRSEIEDDDELKILEKWWRDFQNVTEESREKMIKSVVKTNSGARRSPRKRKKPRAKSASTTAQ